MASLTDIFVTVKPDMDKFGPEVKKKLARIDSAKEGKQVATRFGVGLNGALGSIVSRSAGIFAAGFAAVKVGGFLKGAISQASDLGETTSKVAQIFGPASADIMKFSKTAATALGQTQQAALDANATFGTFGKSAGLKGTALSGFTTKLTTLAGDLASFNNTSPEQAIEAIGAALRGESEPIRAYGVLLDDASMRQQALSMGLIKTTKQALTPQQKVLAAQALIMKQTATAQGDFARTSGGLANQQRILSARFSDFKTTIGAVALPLATKLFGFLNSTAIPVLQGVAAKITSFTQSNGFRSFLTGVGDAARTAFGIFKTEVLPRLQEFAGFFGAQIIPKLQQFGAFLVGNIVPAVQNLIAAFTPLARDVGQAVVAVFQKLAPVVQSLGTSIVGTVLPAIRDFTGWLKDNSTLVGAVAVGVGAMVVAFQAYHLVLGIVAVATKAYAAVQAALNVVMALNPIGIVLLALVGLAAGLVYAYKKSETFRDIVNGVFTKVRDVAVGVFQAVVGAVKTAIDWVKTNWPLLLGILTGPFGLAVILIARNWDAIKSAAQSALRFVVDKVLEFAGNILNAAAKAFGWVPGLGDKLRGAKTEFQKFRNSVNTSLGGINDQTINITPIVLAAQANRRASVDKRLGNRPVGLAAGGGVFGGERGKDSVPALLMPDEHVWTTRETAAVGGHGPMKRLRQAALAGELRGFAAGGGVTVKTKFPPTDAFAANVTRVAVAVAKPMAQTLGNQFAASLASMGPSGPPGSVHTFRGKKLNTRTIGMLLNAEKILGAAFHITQGSYSTSVAASGGTHSGGGAMDTNGPRGWGLAQSALRRAGFAAWHRTPAQGPWGHHIHSIAIGDSSASPSAKRQVQSYLRGGNGLGGGIGNKSSASQRASVQNRLDRLGVNGMAMGGPVGKFAKSLLFDNAGYLPTGKSVVDNQTGKPEPLTRTDQAMDLTPETARLVGKEVGKAISDATFRLTQSGTNGSYLLQMSNG